MKKFLLHSIFGAGICTTFFLIYLLLFANGKGDFYYLRFATSSKPSLILGSSRAAQGIQPKVFNDQNDLQYKLPLFNYGFTRSNSDYGAVYLNAIKEKLDTTTTNGLFIAEVSPISFMIEKSNEKDDPKKFPEASSFLGNLKQFNGTFNLDYLLNQYQSQYAKLLIGNIFSLAELHEDGWLQVNFNADEETMKKRMEKKIKLQQFLFDNYYLSDTRWAYFEKTISYLQKYGTVYVVRLPIDPKIQDMENQYIPDFDTQINRIVGKLKINYINLSDLSGKYKTTDGNHLYKTDGEKVSKLILERIKNLASNKFTK